MQLETTGTSLLVEVLTGDGDLYTIGPFDEDEQYLQTAKQLLTDLRPEDRHLSGSEISSDDGTLSDFKEACLLAINAENEVTMVIWDIDNREGI